MSLTSKLFLSGSGSLPLRTVQPSKQKPGGQYTDPASGGVASPTTQTTGIQPNAPAPSGLAAKVAGRQFGAATQNRLGTMEFRNLQPRGASMGGLAGKVAAAGAAGGAASPQPGMGEQSTVGFTSYVDEQLGGAGFILSGANRKGGWVAQSGAYRGQTRPAAEAKLRAKYAAMTPEQRMAYEARGNNSDIGDITPTASPSPTASAVPPPAMDDPTMMTGMPLDPLSVDETAGGLTRRARRGASRSMMA